MRLTRTRCNYVFKSVNFYIYHDWVGEEGLQLGAIFEKRILLAASLQPETGSARLGSLGKAEGAVCESRQLYGNRTGCLSPVVASGALALQLLTTDFRPPASGL